MKVKTFMPEYMKEFQCVGSQCTDTCCAGWDINIDENTFSRYQCSTGELKKLVKGKYIENNDPQDNFNYGFMILTEENKCPFLNENMLCDIHGNLGEENLCITCKSYPRVFNIVDEIYEKSGLPSCIEVCNAGLLNKNKMEFIELEEEINEDEIEIRRIIDTEAFQGSDTLIEYFWDIRVISINIMQSRDFSIENRLSILKNFYKRIVNCYEEDNYDELESLLEELSEESINLYDFIEHQSEQNKSIYNAICTDELINNIRNKDLKKCVLQYKNSINKNRDLSLYNCLEELNTYSYIFENYLVNQIFKDLIPFNKGADIISSINVLINTYKVLKLYIIGVAIDSGSNMNEQLIIEVIKSFSKDIEHNKVFKKLLEGVFE